MAAVASASTGRRILAIAGGLCALGSLAFPYATLIGFGQRVPVTPSIRGRMVLLVLAVLVVVGAGLALYDFTRGEQLLGALFAVLLFTTVVGPLFVPELQGVPELGLWLLFIGWLLVDSADVLDPNLTHERLGRRVPLLALSVLASTGSVFLWVHRIGLSEGWTTIRRGLWLSSGILAVSAWLVAFYWEWTAVRA